MRTRRQRPRTVSSTSFIETSGRPIFSKARRLDSKKLNIAKREFQHLEKLGIVRHSTSPWASPLNMVPKPGGGWWSCGDYRHLNQITTPDRYLLPNMQDLANHLHSATVFSKLDLVKGYHQVPVAEADKAKATIITPFGLFEYNFMPFGLRNASQKFQRLIDQNFQDLSFCFPFADDNLVGSVTAAAILSISGRFFRLWRSAALPSTLPSASLGSPPSLSSGTRYPPAA